MASWSDDLVAWSEAHRAYCDAAEVVLGKERHGAHDLDVVESLCWDVLRKLTRYRSSRGEPSLEPSLEDP